MPARAPRARAAPRTAGRLARRRFLVRIAVGAVLALAAAPAAAATPVRPILPPAAPAIQFAPSAASQRVYGTRNDTLWRSDDRGATWAAIEHPPYRLCSFIVSPANAGWLYSSCQIMSLDGGATWRGMGAVEELPAIDGAGTLYRFHYGVAPLLQRCTPDAATCSDLPAPGLGANPRADPASQGLLLSGAQVSRDGGATWAPMASPPAPIGSPGITFDGAVPQRLIAAGRDLDGHPLMAFSPDAGTTWGPARAIPLAADAQATGSVLTGGSGAQRRTWYVSGSGAAWTSDDGATFHAVTLPVLDGSLSVDPADGAHLFAGADGTLYESHDGGGSWLVRNARQFGTAAVTSFTGSGSSLYALIGHTLWSTGDAGLTWSPVPALRGAYVTSAIAARDDPRIAYAGGAGGGARTVWRTADGGLTWDPRAAPPYSTSTSFEWVDSGHPDWVSANGEISHDGARTWGETDLATACFVNFTATPEGSASGSSSCDRFFATDALSAPWDQPFSTARSVLLDRARGVMVSLDPLGVIGRDWSLTGACAAPHAPCSGVVFDSEGSGDAWLADGHLTYAYAHGGVLWAERDGGRWWRVATPAGADAASMPLRLTGHDAVAYGGLLIPLAAPLLPRPAVAQSGSSLSCTTPLTADDADLAFAWRRDGAAIADAGSVHQIVPADAGRALGCSITAANAWGSAAASSDPVAVRLAAGAARHRLGLSGAAAVRSLLRCGASTRIDWLRGGRPIARAHGRTHRVAPVDEGHALACRTHVAGGLVETSANLRIPAPHGGRAAPPPVRP